MFDQAFDVPVVVHEVDGEPVEQFGVAGVFALGAEVGGGGDEAGAEEDLPEAIHFDAGGERMLAHRHPVGEAEAVGRRAGGQRREHGGRACGDFFFGLRVVAAIEDVGFARRWGDVHHHRWELFGDDVEAFFEVGQCDAIALGGVGVVGEVVAEFCPGRSGGSLSSRELCVSC